MVSQHAVERDAILFRHNKHMRYFVAFLIMLFIIPSQFAWAASFDVAGWIPYWQDTAGIKSATKNIRDLDIVYPFAFTVKNDGTLADQADLGDRQWQKFFDLADRRHVTVMPTVMWSDGEAIDAVLRDDDKRADHIAAIVDMVEEGDYAGVNIDYESKLSDTIDYFSLFLKELKAALGDKHYLSCAIEPRTPPESLYRNVPDTIKYANDYTAIAKYCDWVELMTYDQQRADLDLNSERKGEPYIPVSDPDWVEKVIKLALKDIPAQKIMLGVPTYGRVWKLSVAPEWYKEYSYVKSINYDDAKSIYRKYDVVPGRNAAGELSFSYFPDDSVFKVLHSLPVPKGTRKGFEDAARALLFANATGMTVPVNLAWYSDADAIKDKVKLVEKYDLKGVAVFKIDGDEDYTLWRSF